MKKVININFQGRIVPIEESAYDILKQYTESLSKFFVNEEGKEEIINDIEGRIAELFAETLKKGSTCIADDDINKIISSMGRPQDFEAEEINVKEQLNGNNASKEQQQYTNANTTTRSKMFRDENNKILGGVCSGLANYFNVDATIVRIIAIILIFTFGVSILPYFILWVVVPSSSTKIIGSLRKRLFRDSDDKVIAGVCSGLSQYFGINIWIPRLLFLLPLFSVVFKVGNMAFFDFPDFLKFSASPGSFVIYVIFWIILPEAVTAADKLEMKGEKVDVNSIKNTIQNDLEGFGKKVEDWGERVSKKASEVNGNVIEKTQSFASDANTIAKKSRGGLGNIIIMIFKIFAYTIIGIVLSSILISLFGAGIALTGLLPIKGYLINNGWQNIFAWGTLILFIWIPIIGALTFIIRRLTKSKRNSNAIRYTFTALWVVGWVCIFAFIISLINDFRYKNTPIEEVVYLKNTKVNSLLVNSKAFNKYYNESWFNIAPFSNIGEDTVFVKNFRIRIVKSTDDNYQVKMVKLSNGKSKNDATEKANAIQFQIYQEDSILKLAKGIAINKADKFRNQHVIITIAVPVGKKIKISDDSFWGHNNKVNIGWDDEDWGNYVHDYFGDAESFSYSSNVEYIMTEKGLKKTDKETFTIDEDNEDLENDKLEKYKNSREELKQQIEEQKREIEEKAKDLKEKEREFNKSIDSSLNKRTTQNTFNENLKLPKVLSSHIYLSNILMDRFSI